MRKYIKLHVWLLAAILFMLSLMLPAFALVNPSYMYCTSLGYEYENGMCRISDTQEVNAWDFIEGKAALEHSFCAKEGYEIITIKDRERCAIYGTEECAVCVIEGEEKGIADAMNINFEETSCGDGNCGLPENSQTCPKDCPKGGFDMYCDEGFDDLDCVEPLTEEMILKDVEERKKAEAEREEKIKKEQLQRSLIKKIIIYSVGGIVLAIILFRLIRYLKQKPKNNKKV